MNYILRKSNKEYLKGSLEEKYANKFNEMLEKYGTHPYAGPEFIYFLSVFCEVLKDYEKDVYESYGISDYVEENINQSFDDYVKNVNENIRNHYKEMNLEHVYLADKAYLVLLDSYIKALETLRNNNDFAVINIVTSNFHTCLKIIEDVKNGIIHVSELDKIKNIDLFTYNGNILTISSLDKNKPTLYISEHPLRDEKANIIKGKYSFAKVLSKDDDYYRVFGLTSDTEGVQTIPIDIFLENFISLKDLLSLSVFRGKENANGQILLYQYLYTSVILNPNEELTIEYHVDFIKFNKLASRDVKSYEDREYTMKVFEEQINRYYQEYQNSIQRTRIKK